MPQENVELVRTCVDALNERDVDRYLACCADHVELVPATAAIEGTYTGRSGIRRFFTDVADSSPDFHLDIERLQVLGSERVLSFERGSASGRTSGVNLEEGITFGTVYDLADGKIERIPVFTDRQQALEAAGLGE